MLHRHSARHPDAPDGRGVERHEQSCTIPRSATIPHMIPPCTTPNTTARRAFLHALATVRRRDARRLRRVLRGSVLKETRGTLNETAAQTNAEQMLRNIVRLRYGDTPYFLEVSSVSTSATVSASVARECRWARPGIDPTLGASAGDGDCRRRPSFVFQPLAGEKFAKQLLRPLDLRTLALLRAAGFGLREILLVFADAINGVPNAPAATLYAPREMPGLDVIPAGWRTWSSVSRPRGCLQLGVDSTGRSAGAGQRTSCCQVSIDRAAVGSAEFEEFARIARPRSEGPHLPRGGGSGWRWGPQHRVAAALDPRGDALPVQGRRGARCRRRGRTGAGTERRGGSAVRLEPDAGGRHPHRLPGRRPGDAYVRVRAHERWFYIDARDIASKQTFALLETAYALQAGDVPPVTTILTLPIAR